MAGIKNVPQLQIKVTLDGIKPPIWRRIVVPGSLFLGDFHDLLQGAMGWKNSHMHHFIVRGEFYGTPDPEFGEKINSEAKMHLDLALMKEKDSIIYEYDFGDGWVHKITLEKILAPKTYPAIPICIAGARACPPEDCGGPWGYQNLLKAIKDPSHPEHEDMLEWIGGDFDPEYFDAVEINKWLTE